MKNKGIFFDKNFPKCIYCQNYAFWDGDNACFINGNCQLIDPRKIIDCQNFKLRQCQTKHASDLIININKDKFNWWLKNGDYK